MKQYNNGFTLVELLVTISIVMLLMVVAIPNFSKYRNLNDLGNAAKLIQSEIYKARSLALAPATDKNPLTNSYGIFITKDASNNYTMTVQELNYIDAAHITKYQKLDEINVSKNIRITCDGAGDCFSAIFSIEGYGKITYIKSATSSGVDILDFPIQITSNKVSGISKKIITNKVTEQVSIKTVQ